MAGRRPMDDIPTFMSTNPGYAEGNDAPRDEARARVDRLPSVRGLEIRPRALLLLAPTICKRYLRAARLFRRRRIQYFPGVGGVLLAHQKLEAGARPCDVVALASGRIRLDHGIDARGLERALGEIGFDLGPALVNHHQIRVIHNP